MKTEANRSRLRVLRTGDTKSRFNHFTAKEVLAQLGSPRCLLSSSAKAEKSAKVGVLNRVLYLTSGIFCPGATDGCLKVCLGHSSGRMQAPMATKARDRRSALYLEDQDQFLAILRADLRSLLQEARSKGMVPACRLNGTSDIPWETLHGELFEEFRNIQFFDYTKLRPRMHQFLAGQIGEKTWPTNYHLTFSLSEKNAVDATGILQRGGNVATVFSPWVPSTWRGFECIDGDTHDARFLDVRPRVVGLSAKGIASEDLSGFVVNTLAA